MYLMSASLHWSGWTHRVDPVTCGRLVQQCFIGWPGCRMVGDYTGLKTWDVKSNDNDNDLLVANKLKRWGESRCRPGAGHLPILLRLLLKTGQRIRHTWLAAVSLSLSLWLPLSLWFFFVFAFFPHLSPFLHSTALQPYQVCRSGNLVTT